MNSNKKIIITVILLIGIIYRLLITSGGNFIFNMDSARDMVDIREMVVLKKLRLTGPNTPIPGIYDGPLWYYLLAIPFIISSGDPYGSLLMQIVLWAIGGFYLLKLTSRFGILAILSIGSLWVASNFIVLSNVYAFNPNPIIFLTPLFIYLLEKYIANQHLILSVMIGFLAGLFFNLEMNFGVFIPFIILLSILFLKKGFILKKRNFWIGVFIFILTLLPQILFDIKHEFIMSKGLIAHLNREAGQIDLYNRLQDIIKSFYSTFVPTILNTKYLSISIIILFIPIFFRFLRQNKKDPLVIVCFIYIFLPFTFYLYLPVAVNPWHLGGEMVASIILVGFLIKSLQDINFGGKLISFSLSFLIIFFTAKNILNFFIFDMGKPNMDPSTYKNEIAAIDFVYKYAEGKNFKVYTYLPSVIDYPYQYLIWWYGQKKYGYIPGEYAYAPDKPQYISNKEKFEGRKDNFSGLIFLIKEPNRNYTRFGWEGDFVKYNWKTIEKQMVGPIEVEVKKETSQL